MIRKKFLIPEYYIQKEPYCDDCNIPLNFTGQSLLSAPLQHIYKCPKCEKTYNIYENEIQGEWKWKTI